MRRTAAVLGCLLALAGLSGCGGSGTGDLTYVGGSGDVVKVPDRGAPVDVSGTTVRGKPLDLAADRGKVVVVNLWWSGCAPCIKEMPMLVDTEHSYAKGSTKGKVAFVGIDIRDLARANAAAFERGRGVDYPSLYDPSSRTLGAFGQYSPASTPATLLLDKQGRVAYLINGPIPSQTTLTELVGDLLKEGR